MCRHVDTISVGNNKGLSVLDPMTSGTLPATDGSCGAIELPCSAGSIMCIPIPTIQNVVSTFRLNGDNQKFDMQVMAMILPFMEFNSKRFAAGILRLVSPRTTCLVFASGNAVCTGARSEQLSHTACLRYTELLKKSGYAMQFHQFKVENIVAVVYCGFFLDLVAIAQSAVGWVSYEPALFPGLMFRKRMGRDEPKPRCSSDKNKRKKRNNKKHTIVFICFQSGKCVITGGQSKLQIDNEWKTFFHDTLRYYKALSNHGSSGNYRKSRQQQFESQSDEWILQQIATSAMPTNVQKMYNKSDDVQLQLSRTAETHAAAGIANFIRSRDPMGAVSDMSDMSLRFRPIQLGT